MGPDQISGDTANGIPDSEKGYDHSEETDDQPQTGETTERQPSWRPGGTPAGEGVYTGGDQSTSTGTADEPEGPGI